MLILAGNGLTDLPPEIGRLHRLATLDLGHNHLTSVPVELGDLAELSGFLYLHDNKLSEIPDSLGNLTRLRYLKCRREHAHRPARGHRPHVRTHRTPDLRAAGANSFGAAHAGHGCPGRRPP